MTNLEAQSKKIEEYENLKPRMGFHCIVSRLRRGMAVDSPCFETLCAGCKRDNLKWLLSDYEPRELKNGDTINRGQLIEVSLDREDWFKRSFLAYIDGNFWCLEASGSVCAYKWPHARLPEREGC